MVPWWLLLAAGLYATAAAIRSIFLEDWALAAGYAVLAAVNLFFAVRNRKAAAEQQPKERKKT